MEVVSHVRDICKQTKTKEEMVQMTLTQNNYSSEIRIMKNYLRLDICHDCLKKKGIVIEKTEGQSDDEKFKKNEKTLQDKFIEILDELGVSFYE